MKQRKKPLFLITIVVTLVVVVLGFNMSQFLRDPNRIKKVPAPNAEAVEKMRDRPVSSNVPDDVQVGSLISESSMELAGGESMTPKSSVPVNPSIALPRLQSSRSPYQQDVTSGQWWKENSKAQKTSAEKKGIYEGTQD